MARRVDWMMSDWSTSQPIFSRRDVRQTTSRLALTMLDGCLILAAFALAHWLRYDVRLGRDIYDPASYRQLSAFYPMMVVFMLTLSTTLHWRGFYRLPRSASAFDSFSIIVTSTTIALALTVMWLFINRADLWSRLIMVFVWFCVIVALTLGRVGLRMLRRWAWRRGVGLEQVVVVGNRGLAKQVMEELQYTLDHGHHLLGYVEGPPDDRDDVAAPGEQFRWLGALGQFEQIMRQRHVDQVIIALPFWAHTSLPEVVRICRKFNVEFRVAPDLYELSFDRVSIQRLSTIPLLRLKKNVIRGWNYVFKRTTDLLLIGLTAPIWATIWGIAALMIKLSAPQAPVVFRQPRIGKHGKPFMVYKLRTMVPNAEALKKTLMAQNEAEGALFKIKDDPRVTKIGRVLRKLSIDELPQLYNVLRGEMSLVGPRPQVPDEVAQYQEWHYRRLEVTPGLTGLWQASGRSNTTFDDMVRLDIYYTEHWSLWLDVRIMIMTIPAVLFGRGAY
ncbi:sugar transferase [Herpetosiphon llansteffanensis]